eukprot:307450_1
MAHKSNGQIVRYSKGKTKFEILTKKGAALKFRQKQLGLQHVLMIDQIFTKLSQGKVAKSSELQRVFGSTDLNECATKILEHGELNLSSCERKGKTKAKRNEIVYYIHRNYTNPLSKLPHPTTRISHCMDECKIRVNDTKSTRTQALNAIKKMSGKLFFAKANMLGVHLTVTYKHDLHKIGQFIYKITCGGSFQQKWNDKGCVFVLEISKNDLDDLVDKMNKVTNGGDYDLRVVDQDTSHRIEDSCTKKAKRSKKRMDYMMDAKDLKKMNRKKNKKRLNHA